MRNQTLVLTLLVPLFTGALRGQQQSGTVPIYEVTVIERTVKAVNYRYRKGPTRIDFEGTVLLPKSTGGASVESKPGRVEIAAWFERVEPAARFGAAYLTYVLWAVTPEGHAKNLGEVLADYSNRARLEVTTDLQTFGLIVTAEPYFAVRQPSNVVVLQNQPRRDTAGVAETINARFELLPRGHYTFIPGETGAPPSNGEKLPRDRYESLLEVYQALNAVQIARSEGADRYAADTLASAEQSLRLAQDLYARKSDRSAVVTAARRSAQTAEDARAIAVVKKQEDELRQARAHVSHEQDRRAQAEADAKRARAQASADRMQLDQERSSRRRTETYAPKRTEALVVAPPPVIIHTRQKPDTSRTELRVRILRELSGAMKARDTPRGLVVEIADVQFRGGELRPDCAARLARVASVLSAHPGMTTAIEGHGDRFSSERAAAVRSALIVAGASPAIGSQDLGTSRPMGPIPAQNRRVEIVITGDAIGRMASWDRSYSLR